MPLGPIEDCSVLEIALAAMMFDFMASMPFIRFFWP